MSKKTEAPIIARIKELQKTSIGQDVKKIKASLTLEDFSTKDIEVACKELGLVAARSAGFTYPDTLAYLSEEPRTEREFFEKILEVGTRNEARWINDRNKIRVTYNAIFTRFGEEFTEEPASKELKDKVKEKANAK